MGKIIRNIGDIEICDSKFRIEENESVPISDNCSIHIQNENMRIEMCKGEFLQHCFGIIYANTQLQHIKDKTTRLDRSITVIESDKICDDELFNLPENLLKEKKLILLSEITDRITGFCNDSEILFLANKNDEDCISKFLYEEGYQRIMHPYGKMAGYNLLYNISEFQCWKKSNKKTKLSIFFEMNCMSLMPKTFVPLSERIDFNARRNAIWDDMYGCYRLNAVSETIFVLTRCIFMYGRFTKPSIDVLKKNMNGITMNDLKTELSDVFYSYTDRLIEMLLSEQYKGIVSDYIRYRGY